MRTINYSCVVIISMERIRDKDPDFHFISKMRIWVLFLLPKSYRIVFNLSTSYYTSIVLRERPTFGLSQIQFSSTVDLDLVQYQFFLVF